MYNSTGTTSLDLFLRLAAIRDTCTHLLVPLASCTVTDHSEDDTGSVPCPGLKKELYMSKFPVSEYSHSSHTGNIPDGRNAPRLIASPSGKHGDYRRNTARWSPLLKEHCSEKKQTTFNNIIVQ